MGHDAVITPLKSDEAGVFAHVPSAHLTVPEAHPPTGAIVSRTSGTNVGVVASHAASCDKVIFPAHIRFVHTCELRGQLCNGEPPQKEASS